MRHGCEHTVFGSALDGVRPCRIRCHRPHVFVCAGSVAYILATVHSPVLTCLPAIPATVHLYLLRSTYLSWPVYLNGFDAAVWHRAARLRTQCFWLRCRCCSTLSLPLPTTACWPRAYLMTQLVLGHVFPSGLLCVCFIRPLGLADWICWPHLGHAWVKARTTTPLRTRNCLPQCPAAFTFPDSTVL